MREAHEFLIGEMFAPRGLIMKRTPAARHVTAPFLYQPVCQPHEHKHEQKFAYEMTLMLRQVK